MKKTHQMFLAILILLGLALPVLSQPGRWSEPYNISNNEWGSVDPDMEVGPDGRFHLVWADFSRLGVLQSYDILYSAFDGRDWSEPVIISTLDTTNSRFPRVAVDSNGYPHVVWAKNWTPSPEIYYSSFTDSCWTEPINLSTLTGYSSHPDIAIDGNDYIHVVWYDDCFGNTDIVHTFYNGEEWSDLINVSNEPFNSLDPRIEADSENNIHLVWSSSTGANADIRYSVYEGFSWSPSAIISNLPALLAKQPFIAIDNSDDPYVLWKQYLGGDFKEIYYSFKEGDDWTEPYNLTNLGGIAQYPSLAIDDDNIKCLLFEYRQNGSDDPYMNYMIESEGIWSYPDSVSIEYRGSVCSAVIYYNWKFHACIVFAFNFYKDIGYTYYEIPNFISGDDFEPTPDFSLNCYPNPFNAQAVASIKLQVSSHVNLTVYDISGREVQSLVNSHQSSGNHEVIWDATGMSSGIYLLRLEAGEFTQTNKLLLVK